MTVFQEKLRNRSSDGPTELYKIKNAVPGRECDLINGAAFFINKIFF